MFLKNKYTKLYFKIINNRKRNSLPNNIYTETHHIIPQSLGGTNYKNNLIKLTAREHFICHYLLTKMIDKNKNYGYYKKMIKAFSIMKAGSQNHDNMNRYYNARLYESKRKEKK